jgi:RHS repeat-associated protein
VPASGDAAGLDDWNDTDEYGNPLSPAAVGTTATNPGGTEATDTTGGLGYGWTGANQRATSSTGLLLMGARLYNPTTGQFTSLDPIYGGNTAPYAYPQDPVNGYDLTGQADLAMGGGAGVSGEGFAAEEGGFRGRGRTEPGNRGAKNSGRWYDSEEEARAAAEKYAKKHPHTRVFRGLCRNGCHYHVDSVNRRGEIFHTRHYWFP